MYAYMQMVLLIKDTQQFIYKIIEFRDQFTHACAESKMYA